MSELKPCPFCGRTPIVDDCGDNRYFVKCKCGIVQDNLYTQKCDAVRRWNTRKTGKFAKDTNVPSNDCISTCEYWDDESNFCALQRPPAQPQQTFLTNDDIETIRIHLAVFKENLIEDIKECIEAKYASCEWKQAQGLEVALERIKEAPTIEPEQKN